jgi:hypothetical protein
LALYEVGSGEALFTFIPYKLNIVNIDRLNYESRTSIKMDLKVRNGEKIPSLVGIFKNCTKHWERKPLKSFCSLTKQLQSRFSAKRSANNWA